MKCCSMRLKQIESLKLSRSADLSIKYDVRDREIDKMKHLYVLYEMVVVVALEHIESLLA